MRKDSKTALLMTIVTTILLGVLYPLAVTGVSQLLFPVQANGSLVEKDGRVIGSRLIGQAFSSPRYFQPRPSAASGGYDAGSSSASNLGPTSQALISRVQAEVKKRQSENPGAPIPVDLVTASGSGLDPDISVAAAEFQAPRVARERGMRVEKVLELVRKHTAERQFGFLGEPHVNVLELNLDLDAAPTSQ